MLRSEKNWRGGILTALLALVMALALLPTQALAKASSGTDQMKFYDVLPSGEVRLVFTDSFRYTMNEDTDEQVNPSWQSLAHWNAIPNQGQHDGWTFKHWSPSVGGPSVGNPILMIDENVSALYAVWEKNTYTVTFDTGEGGSAVAPQEIDKANPTPATKPADPTRDGYRFAGWADGSGAAFDFSTTITADTTVIAMWVKTWTVTFDTGDGGPAVAPQTVDNGSPVVLPEDPVWEGYTFLYWILESPLEYNNEPITKDTTLTAYWSRIQTVLEFYVDDSGFSSYYRSFDYGTTITAPADPTKDGKVFVCWLDKDGNPYQFGSTVNSNPIICLYAQWRDAEHTVTFDMGDGSEPITATVDDNATATAPADPTREGYDFLGWFGEDGEEYDFSTPVTADVALAAKWQEQVFEMSASATEVSFDDAEAGYGPVAAKVVTVTNTGNQPLAITSIEVPEGFEFTASVRTRATGYGTLEPGDSLDIAVRPVDGLEPGDYEGDLVVTSDGGEVARVALAFNVAEGDPEPGVDPEPGDPSDGGDPADDGEPAADPKPADPKPAGTEPATTVTTTVTTTTVTTAAKAKVPATGDPASAAGLVALLGVMASAAGVATRRR